MGRLGNAITLAWLATFWLIAVLVMSIVGYTRGLDVVALAIALIVQAVVVIAWTVYRPLPLWIIAGHGLILIALVVGLGITAPGAAVGQTLFGLNVAWLAVGLLPTGVAMILAALVGWNREHVVGH